MKILYFAWVRERVGLGEEDIALPPSVGTVGGLIDWLNTRGENYQAAFQDLRVIRAAVDQNHVQLDAPLNDAREVAFFPPVSGG